jgi:protein involved in polysaccharide export with SLBB domain
MQFNACIESARFAGFREAAGSADTGGEPGMPPSLAGREAIMHEPIFRVVARRGLLIAAVLLAGCSLTPGNRLTLFPEGHRLIDQAKDMRQAATEPATLPRELDKRVLPPYVVEPGDVLLVLPADPDSPIRLPGDQPVLPDGAINLGKYGQLVVAGKTVAEIETAVRAAIQAQLTGARPMPPAKNGDLNEPPPPMPGTRPAEPREIGPMTVRVVTRQSKVYYVLGEVNAPGSFTLNGREAVLDGVLAAGGLNDRASRRNIILARPTPADSCRIVLPVCYYDIVQLGDTATNYQLAPGDRIYVPTRSYSEELHHNQPECPPCNRPQTPCQLHGKAGGGDDHPPPVPFPEAAPPLPAPEPIPDRPTETLPRPRSDEVQQTRYVPAGNPGDHRGGSLLHKLGDFISP